MEQAYIYIVNETFSCPPQQPAINDQYPVRVGDFSEKVFKGFMYGKPMFLNARAGTIKMLEDLGFDMLGDIIDNSYDNIQDAPVRIDAMLESAKACPKPSSDMIERMDKNNKVVRSKEFWWSTQKEFIQTLLDNHY